MLKIPVLDYNIQGFPPISHALDEPNGLLAAGGDLSPKRLLDAYSKGIFPWFEDGQPILWWSPDPRAILLPNELHISKSLKKTLNAGTYSVTMDTAFEHVIQACSAPRPYASGTWITNDMIEAYIHLHELGHAHSVEAWFEGQLVGGLYGVNIGKLFFGESMFSFKSDASKVAFVHLVHQLQQWECPLIDCQVGNPHLMSLGAHEIPRTTFQYYLDNYLSLQMNANHNDSQKWIMDWQYKKV